MKIKNIDHIVLTVRSIQDTSVFYKEVLGMQVENFAGDRVALNFSAQKINLHEAGNEFEPKAHLPTPGSADLCLIVHGSLNVALEHVKSQGIKIVQEPIQRTGANGPIMSFYIRDPDGNLIELSSYLTKVS